MVNPVGLNRVDTILVARNGQLPHGQLLHGQLPHGQLPQCDMWKSG